MSGKCFCERFVPFTVTGPREARRSRDEAGRLNPRRHPQIEIHGEAKPGEAGAKPALLSHVLKGELVRKVVRPGFYIYYYIEGGVVRRGISCHKLSRILERPRRARNRGSGRKRSYVAH